MKWHFYNKREAPYSFDCIIPIESFDESDIINEFKDTYGEIPADDVDTIDYIIENYSDELCEELSESTVWNPDKYGFDLEKKISQLFDYPENGTFDWNEETERYYSLFLAMTEFVECEILLDSGECLHNFNCKLSDGGFYLDTTSSTLGIAFLNFYSGNGEPIGAQLALNIVDRFMHNGTWHLGFFDKSGILINDIPSWSRNNILKIDEIKPVVWFGKNNEISNCWSIGVDTDDLTLTEFWGDYYNNALTFICKADEGLGIYYSVCEYGLVYDETIFEEIRASCPVTINAAKEDRINEMFNQIISIYNHCRITFDEKIPLDEYSKNVVDTEVVINNPKYHYEYIKEYKFNLNKIKNLSDQEIEFILLTEKAFQESFHFLEGVVIERMDSSSLNVSYNEVIEVIKVINADFLETTTAIIRYNSSSFTQEINAPFNIDFTKSCLYISTSKILRHIRISALINFIDKGSWHLGYLNSDQLPKVCNEYAIPIPQSGIYPSIWFNTSSCIYDRILMWPNLPDYKYTDILNSPRSLYRRVFYEDIDYNDTESIKRLETPFIRFIDKCPVKINKTKPFIDFDEVRRIINQNNQN